MCKKVDVKDRLRLALENAQMKPIELSQKLNIPKSAISQYLSGKSKPKQDRIYLICKTLDINEAWLMGYDVPMKRTQDDERGFQQSPPISLEEQKLLKSFNELNSTGRAKVIEYSEDLSNNIKYTVPEDLRKFKTRDEAWEYLSKHSIAAFGGINLHNVEDEKLIEFANGLYEDQHK